ncbi:glycoside hydrolase family 113 [Bradyrhizobium sp. AZCC 1693]|uniref:glycoside hydrolase family 113 n=1 Tax=Bradyrhizobium sp. AZCC 1693 TaxID=3117029 RepID=UPI00306DECFC
MTNIFDVQGFGALSEWNGQFSSLSANQAFETIASLGSNSIELTVRIWTQSKTSTSVFAEPAKTESDASLLAGFQAAHAAGLSVVFKAALSPLDGTPTHALAPSDAASFFASYKAEIVHLATIAQQAGVETFVIGNEMGSLTGSQYRAYWTDIISAVRQVYQGELTYAAATDEAWKVSFWDQLDTIGVNTYPPLTSSTTPTVQDLIHAWSEVPFNPYYAAAFEYKSPVDFLHSLSLKYNKPVLMTEVGYRSIDGTAISPGSWTTSATANESAQADAYNAFFQVWTANGGSWFKGVELWQWDLNNQYNSTGYSVMGKSAEALVSEYFHGQRTVPGLTINGSPVADVIDVGSGHNDINGGLGDDVIRSGAGDDVIIGGPATTAKLSTTTLTLTGWGSVVNGVGAQAQILVNGKAVSGIIEFQPATDPSGYQTHTVSFDNTAVGPVNSVDINLVNATPGRALHVKDFLINGVALTPSDGTNASAPGTFDLYVRTIHFDTTNHQDWFVGSSADNDLIDASAGNDAITGGTGNDTVDGDDGLDTAVFQGNLADYAISVVDDQIVISDKVAGRDGTDHLTHVEFLQFADSSVNLTAPPTSPKNLDLAAADDTFGVGTSGTNADNLTRLTSGLTISGSGDSGATVTLFDDVNNNGIIDTGETLTTALVSGGRFAADISLSGDDVHHVKAIETNLVGNVSTVSAALDITIDTLAPMLAATSSRAISANLISINGTGEAGAAVTVSENSTVLATTAVGSTGTWSFKLANVTNVDHTYSIVETDTAGNMSTSFAIHGKSAGSTLTGGAGNDAIYSNGGNDTINGFVGKDTVDGGAGIDTIVLNGTSTNLNNATDLQITNVEAVSAAGSTAAVTIDLHNQSEGFTISGGNFADVIVGGDGRDRIIGGGQGDTLTGGPGNDTFVFKSVFDSKPGTGNFDTILGFTHGSDKIDFSAITGLATVAPAGSAPPQIAAHTIEIVTSGGNTIIYANASNSSESLADVDMEIHLTGVSNLTSFDIVL